MFGFKIFLLAWRRAKGAKARAPFLFFFQYASNKRRRKRVTMKYMHRSGYCCTSDHGVAVCPTNGMSHRDPSNWSEGGQCTQRPVPRPPPLVTCSEWLEAS